MVCFHLLVCFLAIQIFSRSPIANLPLALAWHWVMGLAVRTVTHAQLPSNPIVPIGEIGWAIRCRILSKLKPVCKSPEEIPRAKTRNHVSFTGTVPRVSLPLSEKWKVKFVLGTSIVLYCQLLNLWAKRHQFTTNIYEANSSTTLQGQTSCKSRFGCCMMFYVQQRSWVQGTALINNPHRIGFLPIWPLSYHPLPSLWALHGTTELY